MSKQNDLAENVSGDHFVNGNIVGKVGKKVLVNRVLISILIAVVLIGLVVVSAFDHQAPIIRLAVSLVLSIAVILSVLEMRRALGVERIPHCFSWIVWLYALGISPAYILFGLTGIMLFTLLVFACSAVTALYRSSVESLSYIALMLIYPGMFMACLLYINKCASTQIITDSMPVYDYIIGDIWAHLGNNRMAQLLPYNSIGLAFVFAVSCFTDVFAFLFGVAFGRHKLMPAVSPKKTVEGAIGGLFGGLAGSALVYFAFDFFKIFGDGRGLSIHGLSDFNLILAYVAIGVFGSILTQLGDLLASFVKRYCDIKDYSKLLGSHGGIMDRMDGMMLNAGFVAFVYMFII